MLAVSFYYKKLLYKWQAKSRMQKIFEVSLFFLISFSLAGLVISGVLYWRQQKLRKQYEQVPDEIVDETPVDPRLPSTPERQSSTEPTKSSSMQKKKKEKGYGYPIYRYPPHKISDTDTFSDSTFETLLTTDLS